MNPLYNIWNYNYIQQQAQQQKVGQDQRRNKRRNRDRRMAGKVVLSEADQPQREQSRQRRQQEAPAQRDTVDQTLMHLIVSRPTPRAAAQEHRQKDGEQGADCSDSQQPIPHRRKKL